jgi:hypothetical protein
MELHHFEVGQTVLVTGGRYTRIQLGERFQIVRHLPAEGATPQYHIKSEPNGHEFIVREDEIDAAPPLSPGLIAIAF